jgi:SAM-dependent methyltransferase
MRNTSRRGGARRVVLAIVWALTLAGPLGAQDPQFGDELYRPRLRQPGKDVMWLPTPDAMVTRMLEAAKTTREDIVYDLGAGDGRIPIAAARQFGAKAVGIEYDKDLAALARRNAERAGVADKVTIIQGDIFSEDFSPASVVTLYLLPDLNQQLRPQLLRMKPGTRVVSHLWDMGEWEPDDTLRAGDSEAFVWIVPAPVGGRWTLSDDQDRWGGVLDITQQFQRIGGTLTIRGATQPLLGAYVRGAILGFTFVAPDGGVRSVRARVDGGAFAGSLQFSGNLTPIAGRRASARPSDGVGAKAGNR